MKAKRAQFWACGGCGNPHAMQAQAEACCRCINCGDPGLHVGMPTVCESCRDAQAIVTARLNLEHAQAAYDSAIARMSRK